MTERRSLSVAKALERRICHFLEKVLVVEFPGRLVCVTAAPFSDDLPETLTDVMNGAGVVDVVIGGRAPNPAWVCFRCAIQEHVSAEDWLGSARVVLQQAQKEFTRWPPSEAEVLLEAARRATWDAQQGPQHLRTGRFHPGEGSGSR